MARNTLHLNGAVAVCVLLTLPVTAFAQDAATSAFADCNGCPEMVAIPQGSALLGPEPFEADRKGGEIPQRLVTFAYDFAMGRTEVTRGQFRTFMEATGHEMNSAGCNTWSTYRIMGLDRAIDWSNAGYPQNDTHPVVCVSYNDAFAYTQWLSAQTGKAYRLPSSAEFEYSTRAGTRGPWFWGSANRDACNYANVADQTFRRTHTMAPTFNCDDGFERTAPVANYEANGWGLHDMLGNAWEWTEDCLHRDPAGAPDDGSAWLAENGGECDRRTPRGGSWVSGTDYNRAAAQAGDPAAYRSQLLGFRVALTLD